MKILKYFKKVSFLIFLLTLVSATMFAQDVYVDATNGNDVTGSGTAAAPYASIAKGLSAMDKSGGTLVLKAGTYTGAGLASTNDDIIIRKNQVIDGHAQPAWNDNVVITIRLEQLNGNNVIKISDSDPAQAFTFDVKGGTLNIVSASGTEYMDLTGTVTINLGTANARSVSMNIGTLNSGGGNITATAGATLNINDQSAFTGEAPKTTNPVISYLGKGSQTAGAEAKYGDFGTGTITVNKNSNSDVVTFPATAITKVAGINIAKGGATFQAAVKVYGDVAVGNGGDVNFTSLDLQTNDFNHGGTGDVVISGNLNLKAADGATANDLGQINVTAGGDFTVNGTTEWTESVTANRDFAANYAINLADGNVTLHGVTLSNNNIAGQNYTFTFYNNDNNGTLDVGTVTTHSTGATKSYGILNVTNNNTGTVTVNGDIRNNVVNANAGTINVYGTIGGALTNANVKGKVNVTGATSVAGVLTNAGTNVAPNTGHLALGANTLTLTGSVAHLTNGGVVTATTGGIVVDDAAGANSFNGGTLSNVHIVDGATTTFQTNAVKVTNLTVSDGVLNVGIATTASGTTKLDGGTINVGNFALTTHDFTQTSGTITLANNAASDLNVKGNFNRTAGTFTAGAASEVILSGTAAQNMNGGPSFQLANMSVTNTGGLVTIANTVRASATITIATAATVELGNFNLVFNAATGKMVNNGTIQTTGNTNGAVIFGGAHFVTNGLNVDGMVLNASSSAVFSNIIIDVNSGNDVITTGSAGNIRWTKELFIYSGDLNNNTGVDLAPSGSNASIKRNIATAAPATSLNGIVLGGGGTFNAAAVDYDLTWTGVLTADKTINTTTSVEWDNDNVRNLTQEAAGGSKAVILAGNQDRILKGNLKIVGNSTAANAAKLTGDNGDLTVTGNMDVGENSVVTLANNAGTFLTVKGALTVSKNADITGGIANATSAITLNGNNKAHSIIGKVTALNPFVVNATGVTISGTGAPLVANAAQLNNLELAANATVTVTDIQSIEGPLTTGASSTLSLGLTQDKTSAPVDNDNGEIAGLITLGGSSFTMNSDIEAQAGVDHNKGTLDFGAYDLVLTTAGVFDRAADASAVYASTGGALVSKLAATYDFNGGSIPYWDVKKAITLKDANSDITVSKKLDIQAGGSIINGGADVTIETLMTTVGGAVFTGPGELILAGTEVVASGDPGFQNLTINSTGTATLSSNNATNRDFTITGQLKQIKGNIDIKANNVLLSGAGAVFDRTAGNWSATTGVLAFTGAAAQTFDPGSGWSVPNLAINNTSGGSTEVTTDDNEVFTVTKVLYLVDGDLNTKNGATAKNGLLTLGDGAVIQRDASKSDLNNVPTFGSTVDVWYVTNGGNTGKEIPASNTVLKDCQVNPGAGKTITAASNFTVNGTLYLKSGDLNEAAGKDVTLASGATIERSAGTITNKPQVTSYNLVYKNGANIATGNELVGNKIANMSVLSTGGANVGLSASVTMSGSLTINGATAATQLDFNGHNLTTSGDVTVTKGDITNTGGVLSQLTFNGAAKQMLTVPAAGLVFPSTNATKGMELVLNNTSKAGVHLAGGNLTMQNTAPATNVNIVRFINGNLTTDNDHVLTLWQNHTATNKPHQGFDRTGVDIAHNKYSHVVGNVEKYINNTAGTSIDRTEVVFPVGTADGNYRPASFFFKSAPQSALTLTVNHDESSPNGENGFPVASGDKKITNYPDFFWYVKSDQALAPSYKYDIEFQAEGYGDYVVDGIQDVRLIRRDSGNVANTWVLQGADGNYQNSTINATWPVVKVIDATGGITTQGSKFTYSQLNKAPHFTKTLANVPNPSVPGSVVGGQVAATEGVALTGNYAASDPDVGQTATIFLVSKPDSATFDAATGAFAWTPDFTTAPGPYYVSIGATDGTDTTIVTDTITVADVNRDPYFTAAPAATVNIGEGSEYNFTYVAKDPDADNATLTYSIQALTGTAPDSISIDGTTGKLVIIPAFGEVGNQFNLTVRVTDAAGGTADTLSAFTVTKVNRAPSFVKTMGDTTIDEGQALAFTYTATDPDGNALAFSLAGAPSGATINAATGAFAWTPGYTQAGSYTYKVVVTDDGAPNMSDTSTVTVTVNDKNAAPTWVKVLPDTTIYVGETLTFTYVAEDLDLDKLAFSLNVPHPQSLSITGTTDNTVTISWTPVIADTALYLIGMNANDGTNPAITTEARVTIAVTTVDVSGVVAYNVSNELLKEVTVTLADANGAVVGTDVTGADGAYKFVGIQAGTYTITASKTTQWGGALASDALETQLYVVHPDSTYLATDLQKKAADVVGVGTITSSDALAILNRSVGINDFKVPDWLFETKTITVGTQNVVQNIAGIAAGDARNDYSPAGLPKISNLSVSNEEVVNIKKGSEFELPISINEVAEIGSYTFKLNYAADKVEFLGASTGNGGVLVTNVVDNEISIAWANLDSKNVKVKDGDALVTLQFKATKNFDKSDEVSLELANGAEITDGIAKSIDANISIPVVKINIPDVFALKQNYPNPFNPSTTIQYDLPEDGKVTLTVYNSLGQEVAKLVNQKQEAGSYDVNFNASNLASGVYLYRVIVQGSKNFVMTKKMILMK